MKKKNRLKRRTTMWLTLLTFAIVSLSVTSLSGKEAIAASRGIAQGYEDVLSGDRIINVEVTIADEDWRSILASPLEKEYKSVSVNIDGSVIDNVGFSTKGNLTLRSVANMTDSDRYSFRLKFNKYEKTQNWLGLDKMVLNNNYSDPSYLREYLHYEALRTIGLDAPLTVFVNLFVNGDLYGFYTGVESVDGSYLARNVGADYEEGVLYDTESGSTLKYAENSDYETITRDLGIKDDKASLKNFIKVLNEMPDGEKGDIESVLDVDSALKYIAGNAVLGNYDSYNGSMAQNYMLYGDAAGKFTVIPWDFNMSFNGFTGVGRGGNTGSTNPNTNAVTAAVDLPVLGIRMEDAPMINNLLKVAEYKERYLGYVEQLVDYLEKIENRINELGQLIRPYVEADPTRFYAMEQFDANLAYSSTEGSNMGGMGGMGGMTPPDGMAFPEGMTPPDGRTPPSGITFPEGMTPPTESDGANSTGNRQERPGGGPFGMPGGNGGGQFGGNGGIMAAGSIKTFALDRLANLQEQLGRAVTPLPETSATPGGTEATTAPGEIKVVLDGKTIVFGDQKPVTQNSRVLIPVYGVFESLGAELVWNAKTRTVTVNGGTGNTAIVLPIGGNTATVNGEKVTLDVPAQIVNSRTLVPVRFVAEALGLNVSWDSSSLTVNLIANNQA